MDYLKHYNNLCNSRKLFNRFKGDGNYYESHHIIPRWMGGSNDINNLVLFTAREHFLAHYLLYKHYKDKKSAAAFHMMCNTTNNNYRDSKKYQEIRKFQSDNLKGDKNPSKDESVRKKISQKVSGKNNGMYGMSGEKNPFFKKKHTEEFINYKKEIHGHKIVFNDIEYLSFRDAERITGVSRYKIKKNCVYVKDK